MNVFDVLREKLEKNCHTIEPLYNMPVNVISVEKIKEVVNQVEQEYNDGWISCSERLPDKEEFLKDDGRFIVTDGNRRYESIYDIYCRCFKTLKLFGFNLNGRDARFEVDKCVIAWQPLPPKYEQKGE